ncbi:MAG: hypothetical protein J6Y62_04590 [Clostridia bacterium]|nr:hypothetical protein [Clostridia bacterium]
MIHVCCKNCMFWTAADWVRQFGGDGECHRFPPKNQGGKWPLTDPLDWCGEFRERTEGEDVKFGWREPQ